jgi:hypothetical protein
MYHKLVQGEVIQYNQNLFFNGIKIYLDEFAVNGCKDSFERLTKDNPTLYEVASYINDTNVSSFLKKDDTFIDLVRNELTDIMAEEHGKIILFGDNFLTSISDVYAILRQMNDNSIWKNLGIPVSLNLTEDDLGFLHSCYQKPELRTAKLFSMIREKV